MRICRRPRVRPWAIGRTLEHMKAIPLPTRRFISALYDLAGDHATRMTPFGEIVHQAHLTDAEAHGAFAELKGQGFIKSNRYGCVALTETGRGSIQRSAR